jgi:hypothetical protein
MMASDILLTEIELRIEREHEHRHVEFVLARYPELANEIRSLVTGIHAVALSERRRGEVTRPGLTAGSLNQSLKSAFDAHGGWSFETTVVDGVIYDNPSPDAKKEGFDLSRFDEAANMARLWDQCFGERPLRTGVATWKGYLDKFPDRVPIGDAVALDPSMVRRTRKTAPTILGDIQFGNWGLAYRDLMRLLDADAQVDVDLYVYVTAGPSLGAYLSDGIVDFRIITDALRQFPGLVRTPVWVIALGLGKPIAAAGQPVDSLQ